MNKAIKLEKAIALIAMADKRYAVVDAHNNTKIDFESRTLAEQEFKRKCKLYEIE